MSFYSVPNQPNLTFCFPALSLKTAKFDSFKGANIILVKSSRSLLPVAHVQMVKLLREDNKRLVRVKEPTLDVWYDVKASTKAWKPDQTSEHFKTFGTEMVHINGITRFEKRSKADTITIWFPDTEVKKIADKMNVELVVASEKKEYSHWQHTQRESLSYRAYKLQGFPDNTLWSAFGLRHCNWFLSNVKASTAETSAKCRELDELYQEDST